MTTQVRLEHVVWGEALWSATTAEARCQVGVCLLLLALLVPIDLRLLRKRVFGDT